jgi:hypothetical protein
MNPSQHLARHLNDSTLALDHRWRCETWLDERFTETCAACSGPGYQWFARWVCEACGCQRTGRALI